MASMRKSNGMLAWVVLCFAVLLLFSVGLFTIDVVRLQSAATEMQNATDAAALAAAQNLSNPEAATRCALEIAAQNIVDGEPLSQNVKDVQLNVLITPGDQRQRATVRVRAEKKLRWMFFSQGCADLISTSVAGYSGTLLAAAIDQAFPLAISLDAIPRNRHSTLAALKEHSHFDQIECYLNGQETKNVAFTCFDKPVETEALRKFIDKALRISDQCRIPSIRVGDRISLANGIHGQTLLAKEDKLQALSLKPTLLLPVIQGDPQHRNTASVIGFVVVKVRDVTLNKHAPVVETITLDLLPGAVSGTTGDLPDDDKRPSLQRISAGAIKLVH